MDGVEVDEEGPVLKSGNIFKFGPPRFTTRCKEPEISHCMPIAMGDMLREDVDKLFVFVLH